jgi:hypothetical protein
MNFINVRHKTLHRWSWDVIMKDIDGSLSGQAGNVVVSRTNITDGDTRCYLNSSYKHGAICSNTTDWIRFAFNNTNPSLPVLIDIINEQNDTDIGPFKTKRLTHKKGYMVALEANQAYEINFEGANYPTNISYTGTFYGLMPNQYIIIKHKMRELPDQVVVYTDFASQSLNPLSITANADGHWYWDNSTRTLSYIIHNKQNRSPFFDAVVNFNAKKCRYPKCQLPIQPALSTPLTRRPDNALFWSNPSTWASGIMLRSGQRVTDLLGIPKNNDSIKIPSDVWIVVDTVLPVLGTLQIDGVLEFDDSLDNRLSVYQILINGGQLIIGWENKTFSHNINIELNGDKSSDPFILPNGINSIGIKSIGVYGGLDLHGTPRKPAWTRISQTAIRGTNQLVLNDAVDWNINEEIVLGTTSYEPFETETFKIIAKSNDSRTITLNSSLQFDHIFASETFENGKYYSIAAGVGLLTRNIKITGAQYSNQYNEMLGSRIIVSDYAILVNADGTNTGVYVYYKGFARISDVEFNLFGQFSTYGGDDFAYGILFSDLGSYNPIRPSYLKNSAFHNGFSAAIGILGSASIPITDNVIHQTVDYAIWVEGNSNIIRNNFVVLNVWSGTLLTAYAPFNTKYFGAIDISAADSAVVERNLISGSQRIGLHFRGSPCSGLSLKSGYNHSITGNSVYSSLVGVAILESKDPFSLSCLLISDFTIYKSVSSGLYAQSFTNLIFNSNILIDNQISIFSQVYTPSSLSHISDPTRSVIISDNLIIGTSPSFNCSSDIPPNNINSLYAKSAISYGTPSGGRIGIVWPNFVDAHNGASFKPFYGIISYNSINGLGTFDNNTFAYFNTTCNSQVNAILASSLHNDDGQMPVVFKNTYLYRVMKNSKIFLFRPNIDKINPSDCVDMDCDGLKKNLLTDFDGTFLNYPGSVISQSEYGWGLQSRGLGDFRIPQLALSSLDGHQLSPSSIYSYPGIVRDENLCNYISAWQGYECHGLNYAMLVIESMDSDTENRRLSPVAILSDNRYLDLINGPQDHGWCFGYTCQKRISTFLSLVVSNRSYDIYLTSSPPKTLRFRIIQSNDQFKIRLSMSYTSPNNINVFKGANLVNPTNTDTSSGKLILKDPLGNSDQYMPKITSSAGTNYFDRISKKVYFSIDGSNYIDLIISEEIFIAFGIRATTEDAFFNSANLVSNIADLLGIPPAMIRRVEIVSANGNSIRVARQSSEITLNIVLANDPPTTSNDLIGIQNSSSQLENATASIANQFMFGQLQNNAAMMNLSITSLDVQVSSTQTSIKIISGMKVIQDISGCRAQSPCDYQPILQLLDQDVIKYNVFLKNQFYSRSLKNQPMNILQFGNPLSINITIIQGSTKLINQYQAYFNTNGTAQFQTLGFFNEANNTVVKYSLISQSGVFNA